MPKAQPIKLSKQWVLKALTHLDRDPSKKRVLELETEFRRWLDNSHLALPGNTLSIKKLSGQINPFVLLSHAKLEGLSLVADLESHLKLAKQFSSIETSAGKMLEEITVPVFGWQRTHSSAQSRESIIDAECKGGDVLYVATIKSGPRTLNDDISQRLGRSIATDAPEWGKRRGVQHVDVTYATLYGTFKQSNKKDWRVLLAAYEHLHSQGATILVAPEKRTRLVFYDKGVQVSVHIRNGIKWWSFLGQSGLTFLEVGAALIRATIAPDSNRKEPGSQELKAILEVPEDFNIGILQRNQVEWALFYASWFADAFAF